MNLKTTIGIVAGIIVWWVAFYTSLAVFAFFWPALIEAGRPAIENNDWSQITTAMLSLLIVMYLWVNPIAGWLTVFITKNRNHAWITAIPLFLYAAYAHFYNLWNLLPDWYNLAVPILIPPLVYVGGRLVKLEASQLLEGAEG